MRHDTNRARCQAGLAPLAADPGLLRATGIHARDMAERGFFSHDSPVTGRETPRARVDLSGVRYRRIAEKITEAFYMLCDGGASFYVEDETHCAFRYEDGGPIQRQTYATLARSVLRRWLDSPGHRRNILTPEFTRHGFALAANGETALCAVQVFAG